MSQSRCEIIAAIADLVPTFAEAALGVALYYRQDDGNSIDATWREGRWLWVLRDKAGKIKGCGYAEAARDAMTTALTAARFQAEQAG